MADRDSFLQAIRAAPEDDTLRLVFADWLDEHGDPLGEFIRMQLELEPVRDRLDDPRVRELQHRENVLLELHGDSWLGAAAGIASEYPAFGPVFRRGLPELVCLSLDTFLARGDDLFAACPTLREVSLFGVASRGADLAACPHLAHVETLEIADWLPEDDQAALGATDALRQVQRFRVWVSSAVTLLHSLFDRADDDWPRRIDLLHLLPAHNTRPLWADYGIAPADLVEDLNFALGREVTSLSAPFAAGFPLFGDMGHGFFAGHLPDGTAALAAAAADTVRLLTFREGGTLKDSLTETGRDPEWTLPELADRFGLAPGLIRVREVNPVETGGLTLRLWPRAYIDDYLHRQERPPLMSARAWRERGGVLRRWLQQGRFVIEWDGNEFWADSTGRIFAS